MTQEQQTPPAQEGVTLTLEDLGSVLGIIDVATARGAFKPKEFTAVGTVYEKISKFLEQVKTTAQPEEPAADPASPEA
jgi:hypothetical protein